MTGRRVSVIGGGPAGLLAARLIARDHRGWRVEVFERLPPDDTYGFGIGLSPGLLQALRAADRRLHDDIVDAAFEFSPAVFALPTGTVELPHSHAAAIRRARMLQLMLDHARAAGVQVHVGASATVDDLSGQADLIIGADGVSSAVRARFAEEFGASETLGRGLFIWCGAPVGLEGTVFMPVHTEAGTFVTHSYPYAEGRSTFVIETDEATLHRAGCVTTEFDDAGASDMASLAYLSEAFQPLLNGSALIGNKSRWMPFRTVRCRRRHHENVVLIGDAAATAHPSLGSGTKLALEDAIALASAMRSVGDRPPASVLAHFERRRGVAVRRLQERARRSQLWWESFPERLDLPPERIALAYLSRAGAVSLDKVEIVAGMLARRAAAEFAGAEPTEVSERGLADWVLSRPLHVDGRTMRGRVVQPEAVRRIFPDADLRARTLDVDCNDPWGPAGDALVDRARKLAREGAPLVALAGPPGRLTVLDRMALGERLRRELNILVAVYATDRHLSDAADGLIAGRLDLVTLDDCTNPAT